MTPAVLTRFVPSGAPPREAVGGEPAAIEDVRCVARVRGDGGVRELVIGTDAHGNVVVTNDRGRLGQRARGELAYHDTATSGRTLELHAEPIYIFDLQTVEMLPDAPGPNDPLRVHGVMYGPYSEYDDGAVVPVEGQLTVTRADLLGGLVDGMATAFAYSPDEHGSRCVHALLPGECADVIDTGKGVILALPLAPTWMPDCPLSNDLVVAQLVHDVLGALRADLGVTPAKHGFMSFLRGHGKKKLPEQGTLDELVEAARAALARMAEAPTPEAVALSRRRKL